MILVTGATGTVGSEIIKRLAGSSSPVRAMTRDPAKAQASAPSNVTYLGGDFDDPASVRRACERVERQQLAFVQAAKSSGVRRVVYLSQLHAEPCFADHALPARESPGNGY